MTTGLVQVGLRSDEDISATVLHSLISRYVEFGATLHLYILLICFGFFLLSCCWNLWASKFLSELAPIVVLTTGIIFNFSLPKLLKCTDPGNLLAHFMMMARQYNLYTLLRTTTNEKNKENKWRHSIICTRVRLFARFTEPEQNIYMHTSIWTVCEQMMDDQKRWPKLLSRCSVQFMCNLFNVRSKYVVRC